jgi:hypothetical protein
MASLITVEVVKTWRMKRKSKQNQLPEIVIQWDYLLDPPTHPLTLNREDKLGMQYDNTQDWLASKICSQASAWSALIKQDVW